MKQQNIYTEKLRDSTSQIDDKGILKKIMTKSYGSQQVNIFIQHISNTFYNQISENNQMHVIRCRNYELFITF